VAAIVNGEAVIKIRLEGVQQARAELATLGVGGGGVPVPGGAPGGGALVPGIAPGGPGGAASAAAGGGGGFLSSIMGFAASNPLGAAALAAGGAFVAPIVGDAVGGVFGRLKQAGTDVAESLGLGAWNRRGDAPGKAADRTVQQLGIAGNFMSNEQILAVNRTNRMLVDLETEGENRVRGAIGTKRTEDFFEGISRSLEKIADNTKKTADNSKAPSGTNPVQGPH
jgi:hypothetical protein